MKFNEVLYIKYIMNDVMSAYNVASEGTENV